MATDTTLKFHHQGWLGMQLTAGVRWLMGWLMGRIRRMGGKRLPSREQLDQLVTKYKKV